MQAKDLNHLLSRAGFGWTPDYHSWYGYSKEEAVQQLLQDSADFTPLNIIAHPLAGKRREEVSNLQILLRILSSKKQLEELNVAWIKRMQHTPATLREKMVLFWHNHFATRSPFGYLAQVQHNTLQEHALGNFRDLLHAIAKDPAMILYLNNQQNVKDHPNENFAREVMELFTLGEGHYTEQDIKEAARCFTGWQVNREPVFEKVAALQDKGSKTVLGHSGLVDGEEVIEVLLEQPRTAYFITEKICKAFVHPNPNPAQVEYFARLFREKDYDISALMEALFSSDWFYDTAHHGSLIVSPAEMIVRHSRLLHIQWKDDKRLVQLQHVLGQVLFYPPNVAGWPGGRHWIDGSTLLIRSNLPLQYWQAYTGRNRKLAKDVQLHPVIPDEEDDITTWLTQQAERLLPVPVPASDLSAIQQRSVQQRKAPKVAALLSLLSLPEAQLI